MAAGVMLTPSSKYYESASRKTDDHDGVMLTPSNEYYERASRKTDDHNDVQEEAEKLKFYLHLPLIQVLDSVFSVHGRVIIDFPEISNEQVRNIVWLTMHTIIIAQ